MPILTTGAGAFPAVSVGNSVAYTNFAARCTTAGATLTGSDVTNYSTLLNGLTTDGLFASNGTSTKLDALYILAAPSSTVALLDLTNNAFNLTANGSPTFTAFQGYAGVDSSTTIYLDTGYNPTSSAINLSQNAGHVSAWSNTNTTSGASGGCVMGNANVSTSRIALFPKYADGNNYYSFAEPNASSSTGPANANSTGFYLINRNAASGSTSEQAYKNAADQGITAVASTTLASTNIFILAENQIGPGAVLGSAIQVSAASIGGNLSSTNVTNLFTRIGTYRTAVGL